MADVRTRGEAQLIMQAENISNAHEEQQQARVDAIARELFVRWASRDDDIFMSDFLAETAYSHAEFLECVRATRIKTRRESDSVTAEIRREP